MKRKKIKTALQKVGYTNDSIKSLMCGRALPSMSKAIQLNTDYKIPLHVWKDIKSYLQENDTKQTSKQSTNRK